jgi:formate transporter
MMGDDATQASTTEESGSGVLQPEQIAATTRQQGAKKAALDTPKLLVLGTLAGVYIAFGGLFATLAQAGTDGVWPYGPAQVLAGTVFALGLILVLIGGAELFTGNTLLVVAWAEQAAGVQKVLRALGLAYIANFAGSLAIVLLAFAAGVHTEGEGAVGRVALETAEAKTGLDFWTALASGILANMLVCLAVWLAFGARSAAGKVLVIVPPIAAFVALNLEHSVANMSLIPLGLIVKAFAGAEFWAESGARAVDFPTLTIGGFARNLLASTIGNVIGGVLVGAAYWFAYLRDEDDS